MPYSKKIESEYRDLVRKNFNKVFLYSKTPEEINAFCSLLHSALNNEITDLSIENFIQDNCSDLINVQLKEHLSALIKLAGDEGFELYATKNIINLENREYSSSFADAECTLVNAFTSDKQLRDEKIAEAKVEFITILRNEISQQLYNLSSLSNDEKLKKISSYQTDREQSLLNQQEMAKKQPPEPGSAAHTEYEENSLIQMEYEFQTEQIIEQLNIYPLFAELRTFRTLSQSMSDAIKDFQEKTNFLSNSIIEAQKITISQLNLLNALQPISQFQYAALQESLRNVQFQYDTLQESLPSTQSLYHTFQLSQLTLQSKHVLFEESWRVAQSQYHSLQVLRQLQHLEHEFQLSLQLAQKVTKLFEELPKMIQNNSKLLQGLKTGTSVIDDLFQKQSQNNISNENVSSPIMVTEQSGIPEISIMHTSIQADNQTQSSSNSVRGISHFFMDNDVQQFENENAKKEVEDPSSHTKNTK